VREWKEGDITIRHVVFTISTFKGQKSRLATFYAFPKSDKKLLAFCRFTEAAAGPRPTAGLQGEDAEGKLVFEKLEDWTKRPEQAVKHFSGTAVYEKWFEFQPIPGKSHFLDLGTVAETAKVTLNGKDLGVLWCTPRCIEITDALEAGENELKIEVVNNWPNRLIGDGKLPAEQRRTRTNIEKYNPLKTGEHTLLPSGLLGPVTISTTE
jgi:hypothetical protein